MVDREAAKTISGRNGLQVANKTSADNKAIENRGIRRKKNQQETPTWSHVRHF